MSFDDVEDEDFLDDYSDEDFDEEDSFDVELLFDPDEEKPKLVIRFLEFLGFSFKQPVQEVEEPDSSFTDTDEIHKRSLVRDTIERAISHVTWGHRRTDDMMPDMVVFIVSRVFIRDVEHDDKHDYWLYVELTERDGRKPPFSMPLHEFLEQCAPTGPLTFQDYQS